MIIYKKDKIIIGVIGSLTIFLSFWLHWDYEVIAEQGLTFASITLAIYLFSMISLSNSDLAEKMKNTIVEYGTRTQLGILTTYFKTAIEFAIGTITISSIVLVTPVSNLFLSSSLWSFLLKLGLLFYTENIVCFIMIMRFVLNRQIWNR